MGSRVCVDAADGVTMRYSQWWWCFAREQLERRFNSSQMLTRQKSLVQANVLVD